MTLVETILTVMISALITVPMFGWAMIGIQQHAEVADRNADGASLGVLRTYFASDVADADRAEVGGSPECSRRAGAERLFALTDRDRRIEYLIVPGDDTTMLERHRCSSEAGTAEVVQLVEDLVPGGTRATCAPDRGTCESVTLRVTTAGPLTTVLTAGLRVHEVDAEALLPPSPLIRVDPAEGIAPLPVRVDGTGSTNPSGGTLTYAWDLGDGTISDQPTFEHRYRRSGEFTITLTVTNERGIAARATAQVDVAEGQPTAVIARPAPGTTTLVGSPVELSAEGSLLVDGRLAGPDELIYRWELGDGRTVTDPWATVTYRSASPREGYQLRLTVTDREGRSAQTETRVIVVEPPRLAPPTGLRQTASGWDGWWWRFVDIAWDRRDGADLYEVRVRLVETGEVVTGQLRRTAARVSGMSTGRNWVIEVRARHALSGLWSDWSEPLRVRT